MSNHVSPRPTTDRPAQPAPTYRPVSTTDRPTATFPTGWQACPSGYLPEGPATAARLAQADATQTASFPTGRPQPQHEGARPAPSPAADAASLSHGGARPHAVYHTAQHEGAAAPSPSSRHEGEHEGQPVQDMWRPGPLSKPSMRWHPSLMQLAIGAALVLIALVGLQQYAVAGMADASHRCHALVTSDWDRAQRECRGTPVPEQAPTAPTAPTSQASPSQAPMPERASTTQPDARTGIQPEWVTEDTRAPYDRTDPTASPLSLPRCTTAPDTPLPCLASTFPQNSNEIPTRVVVLEEDGSMSGLVRQ